MPLKVKYVEKGSYILVWYTKKHQNARLDVYKASKHNQRISASD